jgi:predicted DNA-binding transcriptional regulator AlpA
VTIPRFLRQADLTERQISSGGRQTDYLIKHHEFPTGRMLSPLIRGWTEEEVSGWLATRPIKGHCYVPEEKRPRGRPRKYPSPDLKPAA